MTLKSKIQSIFIESGNVFEALPAGVRIPKRLDPDDPDYEDDLDDKKGPYSSYVAPKASLGTTKGGDRVESKKFDIPNMIKNIDTNMGRIHQSVADVKRNLKDIDEKSGSSNLEKFNIDFDKLKSEVDTIKSEWKSMESEPMGKEETDMFMSKAKALAGKIHKDFGDAFYRIKNAIPGQLNGNVWTFSDVEEPEEAPRMAAHVDTPTPSVIPDIPKMSTPIPKVAPKSAEDDWLAKHSKELGGDIDPDDDTRPRHRDYDDEEGSLRETIKGYFKI
jgi:hypothetical protein